MGLVIIMAVLASLGWIKECLLASKHSFIQVLFTIGSLVLIGLILYFQIKQVRLNKYEKDSGKLVFELESEIDHPVFAIGGAKFHKKGDFILFKVLGEELGVSIEKSYWFWKFFPYRQYKLSLTLRNEKNEVLVKIKDNIWKVNSLLIPDNNRNFTENAFEVKNMEDEVILSIRLVDDMLEFEGKFYNKKGDGVALTKQREPFIRERDGVVFPPGGGSMEIKRNFQKLESKIEPIFKYPSLEYPGVLK